MSSQRIRSIAILGGFLDGAELDLADGLNCIIGARGTGKTTLLELVRFALDAIPGRDEDAAERRRIDSLMDRNLKDGRVQLNIETKEGLHYVVSRSAGEQPLVLTPDGKATGITLESGNIFRADIFSQNEIERLADRELSQLALIDKFAKEELAEMESAVRHVKTSLATNAASLLPKLECQRALSEEIATLPSVEDRIKTFTDTAGAAGLTAINQAHANKALRDRERLALEGAVKDLDQFQRELDKSGRFLGERSDYHFGPAIVNGPNASIIGAAQKRLRAAAEKLQEVFAQASNAVTLELDALRKSIADLANVHTEQEVQFRELIEKHNLAEGHAKERTRLEKLRNELQEKQRLLADANVKIAALRTERRQWLRELSRLRDSQFDLRNSVADRINTQLAPTIRVSVIQYGNLEAYQKLLEGHLKDARVKQRIVAERIVDVFGPADLVACMESKDIDLLMSKSGLKEDQATKVLAALSSPEVLFELETVDLHDLAQIDLKDGEEYKPLPELSTGQKCTAVLPILLLDSANPLFVDQPEDNLDNGFIYETVVTKIQAIKDRRQLVFVTHNPNIPVLGDAERVFVLKSDGRAAKVELAGSVDTCKEKIITLLEGGKEAFEARKKRYARKTK